MRPEIQQKIAALPDSPGVYLMKNKRDEVFYVGKAKSLRNRLRGYFSGTDTRAFVALLDHILADLEVVLTTSDKEAFILENELIKQHQPRFNVKLTDDKRFLCLRLDTTKPYPRLEVVRRFKKDGARYFGPYHSASAIREALRLINRHFQLRTCTDQVMATRSRPCLQYQIKRCPAPCVFDLSNGQYSENVQHVTTFLEGRETDLIDQLQVRMKEHAALLEFEQAATLRDQLTAVQRSMERQRVVTADFVNRDVVGYYREGPAIELHVLRTRGGRLIDARRYSFSDTEVPTSEVLADFAGTYYTTGETPPDEILFPPEMEWSDTLVELLREKRGKAVRAYNPQRGNGVNLVQLAMRNAKQAFIDKQREAGNARTALERLQKALRLRSLPESIECFDISHMVGKQIVASAVRFENGAPAKALYRHYKIRSTEDQDDFKSMYEVVSRRARRGLETGDMPKLIVIDGGKGQLNAAHAALVDLQVEGVDLISLAKSRLLEGEEEAQLPAMEGDTSDDDAADLAVEASIDDDAAPDDDAGNEGADADSAKAEAAQSPEAGSAKRSAERVFVFGHKNPIVLRQNSAELFLLVRCRDEAHRFAITFHRKLRGKAGTRSQLDNIPGVGPKRRKQLLKTFGSVARIRQAGVEELAKVVGPKLAATVIEALGPKTS